MCGIGIDYTGSNYMQGKKTFGGKCLHHIDSSELNPYQKVSFSSASQFMFSYFSFSLSLSVCISPPVRLSICLFQSLLLAATTYDKYYLTTWHSFVTKLQYSCPASKNPNRKRTEHKTGSRGLLQKQVWTDSKVSSN